MDIDRIEKTIERFSDRFLDRMFTPQEQERSERKLQSAASYAKRFAAKEAFVKALGLGLRDGMLWTDIEVVNVTHGQPTLVLHGRAAEILAMRCQPGCDARIHLTLSDTKNLAQAFVVIELSSHDPCRN